MPEQFLHARELVGGKGEGNVLFSDVGLSLWGGVDPLTGVVVDIHHPLFGKCLANQVVCLPGGRGSCTGSQTMLELLLNKVAPAALVLGQPDEILALGVIVGEELFDSSFPIVHLQQQDLALLSTAKCARVRDGQVSFDTSNVVAGAPAMPPQAEVRLSDSDRDMLAGKQGKAAQVAMRIVARVAKICGASELISVSQAHIDGCTYIGPGGLRFAERLVEWGGKVRVPTTLNSISVDRQQWRALGISPSLGQPASALADAYLALGATESYTCAPYLLSTAPKKGDQIVWGESNAVAFANSALGARTQKYADYMDICAAITGRVPNAGCHLEQERKATLIIKVPPRFLLREGEGEEEEEKNKLIDDSFYPTLGYLCGMVAGSRVPVVSGFPANSLDMDALKAFSAAFATMASTPMFHIAGNTPEAPDVESALKLGSEEKGRNNNSNNGSGGSGAKCFQNSNNHGGGGSNNNSSSDVSNVPCVQLMEEELYKAWGMLDSGSEDNIELIAIGNPHLSLTEIARIAQLIKSQEDPSAKKLGRVDLIATVGREVLRVARSQGTAQVLESFGVKFISDTCWCMLTEPVVPKRIEVLLTNSAKYAHYAPGLVGKKVRMATLAGCIEAARTGRVPVKARPAWLRSFARSFVTICLRKRC